MAQNILVTGATGSVGSEVVKQLSAKGENVVVKAAAERYNKLLMARRSYLF